MVAGRDDHLLRAIRMSCDPDQLLHRDHGRRAGHRCHVHRRGARSRTSSALDVSPDGRWLVSVDATIPVPPGSVVLRDLTTTTETPLNMGTTVTGSAFSPSGERLAVGLDVSSMTPPSWVWTMNLDGTDRVKVAAGVGSGVAAGEPVSVRVGRSRTGAVAPAVSRWARVDLLLRQPRGRPVPR